MSLFNTLRKTIVTLSLGYLRVSDTTAVRDSANSRFCLDVTFESRKSTVTVGKLQLLSVNGVPALLTFSGLYSVMLTTTSSGKQPRILTTASVAFFMNSDF
jgi:hypothetical protein